MRFDRTYIAIRKRNLLEILDLSLHVMRDYWQPLLVLWLVGCLPFAIFNGIILFEFGADSYDLNSFCLYVLLMTVLVNSQSQVATVFMTVYIGKLMFEERPTVWDVVKATGNSNKYFIWVHGGLRLLIPIMLVTFFVDSTLASDSLIALTVLICGLAFVGLLVRAARPFANEILALEKTPVFAENKRHMTYSRRSRALHSQAHSHVTATALYSVPLLGCAIGTLISIDLALSLHANSEILPVVTYYPIALWCVTGFCAVVRFLTYIDTRIRQEGWEVELRVRAEAQRMEQVAR